MKHSKHHPVFVSEGLEDFEIIGKAGKIIRLVKVKIILSHLILYPWKVMRILRIYKLVRHFAGLQSLFYTLQQAILPSEHLAPL